MVLNIFSSGKRQIKIQREPIRESVLQGITRRTRKKYSLEGKIRVVPEGSKGEVSIAELVVAGGIRSESVLHVEQGVFRGQWVEVRDVRQTIFDRVVTVNSDDSDSGESNWYNLEANFDTPGIPVVYVLWAWGGVRTEEASGWQHLAAAHAELAFSMPWMVVEQRA